MKLSEAIAMAYSSTWKATKDRDRSRDNALQALRSLGDLSVDTIDAPTLVRWISMESTGGRSGPTVNRLLSAVTQALWCAYRAGARPTPPPSGVRLKESRGRKRVLSAEEVLELRTLMEQEQGRIYADFIQFLYETGFRVSEAHGLLWTDVTTRGNQKWAKVRWTKNGDDRSVPLSFAACQVLPAKRHTLVCGGVNRSNFSHAWVRCRQLMGLSGDLEFVPHALRHTRASILLRAGVPLPSIQMWLGHRDLRTTMRYAHTDLGSLERALAAAESL